MTVVTLRQRAAASLSSVLVAALLALLAVGCGDDDDNNTPVDAQADVDTSTDVSEDTGTPSGPTVRFDLDAANGGDFYAFPFPNELRVAQSGGLDLSGFPDRDIAFLQELIAELATSSPGASPNGGVYFAFEAPLDAGSLPQNPGESVLDEATAYLVNVEPGSPFYGLRAVASVSLIEGAGTYNDANTVVIRPTTGFPLRHGERYIAAVGKGLLLSDGEPVGYNELWESIRASVLPPSGVPAEVHSQVRNVLSELEEAGVDPDTVLAASPFATAQPMAELDAIRQAVEDLDFALPENMAVSEQTEGYWIYEGTFPLVDYMQGDAPYDAPGDGRIDFDESGVPVEASSIDARFRLAIPTAAEVPSFPLVVYAHDSGGDATSFIEREGALLTSQGIAVISMDAPLSGERNPTTTDPAELHAELAISNILGARDLRRQFVADQLQLLRMVELLQIHASISPFQAAMDLKTDPLVLMGHGYGAEAHALVVGIEPRVDSAVFSEVGGGAALALFQREVGETNVEEMIHSLLELESGESLDADHPVVGLILQPILDPADPINIAERYFKHSTGTPTDILMTLGTRDREIPADTIVALAVAGGIPPIAPVQQSSPLWLLSGLLAVDAPLQANIAIDNAPECVRDPCTVTAGLISYPLGHTLIYESEDAQNRYLQFLVSALNGNPIIRESL